MEYTSIVIEANGRITLKVGSAEVANISSNLYLSPNPTNGCVSLSCTPTPYDEKDCISLNPAIISHVAGSAFSGDKHALYAALKPYFNT